MISKVFLKKLFYVVLLQTAFGAAINKNVVCYHGTWATYRQSFGKFGVTDIDPFLCTHLIYAFFGIEQSGQLRIIDTYLDLEDNGGRANMKHFNALKLQNPTLKTLAAVGGWNEGSKNFSIVAADAEKRARFVSSAVQLLQRHGFDGLDIDWEYPGQRNNLENNDKNNYQDLLKELKDGLEPFNFLLSAAVGSAEFSAKISYNIPNIVKYLDLINIMAYDLHGPWDSEIGFNAPLYAAQRETTIKAKMLNVDAIIQYWLRNGAPKEKLVLGLPFYGRSFTLMDALQHAPGAAHIGRGLAGQYSAEPGVIGYNEFCEKQKNENWTLAWNAEQQVPYAYRDRQWISFESIESVALKAQYVLHNNLSGIMVWSLESDDFRGICGMGKNPLLKRINLELFGQETPTGLTATINPNENKNKAAAAASIYECSSNVGYVRDAFNCSKFYYCSAGATYRFECPNGLYFDTNTQNCNYANLIKC